MALQELLVILLLGVPGMIGGTWITTVDAVCLLPLGLAFLGALAVGAYVVAPCGPWWLFELLTLYAPMALLAGLLALLWVAVGVTLRALVLGHFNA